MLVVDAGAGDLGWLAGLAGLAAEIEGRTGAAGTERIEVARARTLEEALEIARSAPPDVVIAGPHLPAAAGPGVAERLRELAPVLAVVDEGLTTRGLARAVAAALDRSRLAREVRALRRAEIEASEEARRARQEAEAARYEEARARAQLGALLELVAALSTAATVEQAAAATVARLGAMIGAELASIYTLEGETLHLRDCCGAPAADLARWRTIPLGARTVISDTARLGIPSQISADQLADRYGVEVPAACVWLAVPLRGVDEILGVLGLRFEAALCPDAQIVEYALLVAAVVAQALQRARLLEAARAGEALEEPLRTREPGAAALAEVVRRQVEELRAAHPAREIVAEIAPELGHPCDRLRVSRLVAALIHTALERADPRAAIRVLLSHAQLASAAVLVVEVVEAMASRGPDVPGEARAGDLEPSVIAAPGRAPESGLDLVHELVRSLGGSVIVSSTEGRLRFELLLPAAQSA